MKISSMFHVFIMTVMIFSILFSTFAEQNADQVEAKVDASQDARTVILEAKAAAERDASSNFNQPLWYIGGGAGIALAGYAGTLIGLRIGEAIDPPQDCLYGQGQLPTTGIIVGTIGGFSFGSCATLYAIKNYKVRVPSERLIGKSPEYIRIYTATYRQKIRWLRVTRAMGGAAIIHLGISSCLGQF